MPDVNLWYFATKQEFRLEQPPIKNGDRMGNLNEKWGNDWTARGLTEQCYYLAPHKTGHCSLLIYQGEYGHNPRTGQEEEICDQHEMFTMIDLDVNRKNYATIDTDFCSELKLPHRHNLNDYSWESRPYLQEHDQNMRNDMVEGQPAPQIQAQWVRWRNDTHYMQLRPHIKDNVLLPKEGHHKITRKFLYELTEKWLKQHPWQSSTSMECQNYDKWVTRLITGQDVPTYNISTQDSDRNNFYKVKMDQLDIWKYTKRKAREWLGQRDDQLVVLTPVKKEKI